MCCTEISNIAISSIFFCKQFSIHPSITDKRTINAGRNLRILRQPPAVFRSIQMRSSTECVKIAAAFCQTRIFGELFKDRHQNRTEQTDREKQDKALDQRETFGSIHKKRKF